MRSKFHVSIQYVDKRVKKRKRVNPERKRRRRISKVQTEDEKRDEIIRKNSSRTSKIEYEKETKLWREEREKQISIARENYSLIDCIPQTAYSEYQPYIQIVLPF